MTPPLTWPLAWLSAALIPECPLPPANSHPSFKARSHTTSSRKPSLISQTELGAWSRLPKTLCVSTTDLGPGRLWFVQCKGLLVSRPKP